MSYGISHIIHLFGAFIFIGAVFFEVLILESVRKKVPSDYMRAIQRGISHRARRLMPFVILAIFLSGSYLASVHLRGVSSPLESSFSTLLSLKILVASSVLIHFITAMTLSLREKLTSKRFKFIHLSVFCHMVVIILLAKGMFYLSW